VSDAAAGVSERSEEGGWLTRQCLLAQRFDISSIIDPENASAMLLAFPQLEALKTSCYVAIKSDVAINPLSHSLFETRTSFDADEFLDLPVADMAAILAADDLTVDSESDVINAIKRCPPPIPPLNPPPRWAQVRCLSSGAGDSAEKMQAAATPRNPPPFHPPPPNAPKSSRAFASPSLPQTSLTPSSPAASSPTPLRPTPALLARALPPPPPPPRASGTTELQRRLPWLVYFALFSHSFSP
jgi:hypothetical protein